MFGYKLFESFTDINADLKSLWFIDHHRKCLYYLIVDQYIKFCKLSFTICFELIVHRCVSFGKRLELIVKIDDDLTKWHLILPDNPVVVEKFCSFENSSGVVA